MCSTKAWFPLLPLRCFMFICFELYLLFCCIVAAKESQAGWGWKDLQRSPGPTPLLEQSHPDLVFQDPVQTAFETSRRLWLHDLPGQPMLVLGHPHSEKVFTDVQETAGGEHPMFQSVSVASFFVPWTAVGKVRLCLLSTLPSCIYRHQWDPLQASSSPGRTVPALLACPHRKGASVPYHPRGPPLDSFQCAQVSLVLGGPDPALQVRPHHSWVEGEDHLSWPAGSTLPNATQDTISCFCSKGTLLFRVQVGVHQET